ncbi:MAG: DUF4411 family protein [Fimbriimonadaceae bacterium]|nr:DUF4411 family protein [Fimbriimonadaceae bacterium]
MSTERRFCLDASTLMRMWIETYPKYVAWFDPLWQALREAGAAGVVMVCREVVSEVRNEPLDRWLKSSPGLVLEPTAAELETVAAILGDQRSRALVDIHRERPQADPYVIAQAERRGGIVVTDEAIRRQPGGAPHIPDVCKMRGVECVSSTRFVVEMAQRCGCSRWDAYRAGNC